MIYFWSKYKAKSMKLCINIRHRSAGWGVTETTKESPFMPLCKPQYGIEDSISHKNSNLLESYLIVTE